MKIVYVINSICHLGGIEKITITKANELSKILGNEVWIVVTDNPYEPLLPLNPLVHLVDLGIKYYEDDYKGKLYVLKGIFIKRREHKKKLSILLHDIKPDVIISTGESEKNFLPSIKLHHNPIFIREIHCASNYRRVLAKSVFDKISAFIGDWVDYKWNIRKYDRIVLLTEDDRNEFWSTNAKAIVMPNPITFHVGDTSSLKNNIVVSVGRLTLQKNHVDLIKVWSLVHPKHPNWQLHIWGEGAERNRITSLIEQYELQDCVYLKGYTSDVGSKLLSASIFAMTSILEGFPLALLEAMSIGLPCVYTNCHYGPSSMIKDGGNGFLVEIGAIESMADRINFLIENEEERIRMGKAGFEDALNYLPDRIAHRWMNVFSDAIAEKK